MSYLRKISCVVLVKPESKLVTHILRSIMSISKAFELLHMDLFRPTKYTSIGGNKYGFVIVDDFTRYTWVFFLVDKSDYLQLSNHLSREFTMSLKQTSRK
jgi:hypothetical protein